MLQVQSQRLEPLTTAHLAQTMSLLVLNQQDLQDRVMQELNENPALELMEDRVCPSCHRRLAHQGPCPICSLQQTADEPIVFTSPKDSYRSSHSSGGRVATTSQEVPDREPAAPEDLAIHVLQQLASEIEGNERALAAYILASLDEDGFLKDPLPIIARATRGSLASLNKVVELISHVDPPGLATAGPREALIAQCEVLEENPLARRAKQFLENAFEEIGRHKFDAIAERFEVPRREVDQVISFIQDNLNPYPGSGHWSLNGSAPNQGDANVYYEPDMQISTNRSNPDGPLMVEIFAPVSGWLRISPAFRQAMNGGEVPEEWKEQFDRASLFVKCMQQRENTMQQLMTVLVQTQREFILEGDRQLIPMTRAQVAEIIGVHESTISRAVADKSVALPDRRIIPLSRFFDRSLPARDCLKEIVQTEKEPLTDEEISDRLQDFGVDIARRTVAKYRSMEGIPSARVRAKQRANGAAVSFARV